MGLVRGVELRQADGTPATALVSRIVNGLRGERVLIGSDGPHDNVLKIRPPICFGHGDAEFFLARLRHTVAAVGLR